jgi:hypothetical protein
MTLAMANIGGRAATLATILASQERKIILVESLERLLEKSTRDAFADLLTIVRDDPTYRLVLTCRDYSADLVRAAFLGQFGERRAKPACCRGCKSPTGKEVANPS